MYGVKHFYQATAKSGFKAKFPACTGADKAACPIDGSCFDVMPDIESCGTINLKDLPPAKPNQQGADKCKEVEAKIAELEEPDECVIESESPEDSEINCFLKAGHMRDARTFMLRPFEEVSEVAETCKKHKTSNIPTRQAAPTSAIPPRGLCIYLFQLTAS